MPTVQVGDQSLVVGEFSGRRFIVGTRIARAIAAGWPEIQTELAEFTRRYERENVIELDRAQARFRFGEQTEHLSDEDWERSGNALKMPASPSFQEQVVAVFPRAFELAEEQVLRLMALCAVSNTELADAARDGGREAVDAALDERAQKLLDNGSIEELFELLVVAAEVLNEQVQRKRADLGERVGNLARLFGLGSTNSQDSETSSPSSTDSPEPTDGDRAQPSTSSPSEISSPSLVS